MEMENPNWMIEASAEFDLGILEGGDDSVPDTKIADYGISVLSKPHDKPFFLTVGFHKPHMPWNVPQSTTICTRWTRLNCRLLDQTISTTFQLPEFGWHDPQEITPKSSSLADGRKRSKPTWHRSAISMGK